MQSNSASLAKPPSPPAGPTTNSTQMRILRKGFTRIETLNHLFKLCDTATLPDPGNPDLSTLHYTCRWETTRAAMAEGPNDVEVGCEFKLVIKIRAEGREMDAYTVGRHVHSRQRQRVCSGEGVEEALTTGEEENVTPPPSAEAVNGSQPGPGTILVKEEEVGSPGRVGLKSGGSWVLNFSNTGVI